MWRFEMRSPDGKCFDNRIVFLEIKRPELLVFDHGSDKDNDSGRFRVTITFDEQSDKKTVVTMRQLHPTKMQRDASCPRRRTRRGRGRPTRPESGKKRLLRNDLFRAT